MNEKILTVAEARSWIREYDNGTEDDILTNNIIELLIDNAESYLKEGVGDWYKATPELTTKSKLIALVLVNNWFENRDLTSNVEHVSEKVRHSITSTIQQMQLMKPEVF
ncbi:head-tail connector protein [Senegalia massiliensis]|uniref:Phage gp6-like head-tail connector protein n=1 Tax=Senegalia massiliensis TaxID=1720316 RepID=A0A845QX93_9CLOT|nr:head-tail connector protein [Senegalia massiliensis]NBI05768.1 phage gp6-like head-tail connector protein [Senegalia massiliensis]